MHTPLLFIVFNRPSTTQKVFERIRKLKPAKLYIAADGPRKNVPGEYGLCEQVRDIVRDIDWSCSVETSFKDQNLGCKKAVSSAISWFFEHEEMGIILEDDCLPHPSFFPFCESLLKRYKDDHSVFTISGNNFQPKKRTKHSYYASKYMHCWGWASWRRAWKHYDIDMKDWQSNKWILKTVFDKRSDVKHWEILFDRVSNGEIDTWDYIWQYYIWKKGGINLLPEKNIVTNIGFGNHGTHTTNESSALSCVPLQKISFPLSHPDLLVPNKKADKFTQSNIFNQPLLLRLKNKTMQYLRSKK